jgi:hypothetical protein
MKHEDRAIRRARTIMTEREWMNCINPELMLTYVRGKASNRKLRLLACACCRCVWHLIPEGACRKAVEVGERYADGLATEAELHAVARAAIRFYGNFTVLSSEGHASAEACAAAVAIVDNARSMEEAATHAFAAVAYAAEIHSKKSSYRPDHPDQVALIRDLFGNPFRPMPHSAPWLAENNSAIVNLAQTIYTERNFARMPSLSNALESSGCTNLEILAHCQGPGPHVHGCWVLDLLLGKS